MAARRVTLAHVARAAHVSVSTASAALRGSTRINADTAAHVREVAARLGYRANSAAAGLRRGDPELVGLLLSRSAFEPDPTSPRLFWPRFLTGFAEGLAAVGHGMVVVTEESRELLARTPIQAVAMAGDPTVDGRSVVPFGTPVLRWGDPLTGDFAGHDYVEIAELVVMRAREAGRRHLGLVFADARIPGMAVLRDRLAEACSREGLAATVCGAGADEIDAAVGAGVDAFITPGTAVAQILRTLLVGRHRIPEDVAVLSVSEGDVVSHLEPAVTHMDLQGRASGELVAAECLRLMRGGSPAPLVLPFRFVPGASL
jgi:LacI family transcriptional regulator